MISAVRQRQIREEEEYRRQIQRAMTSGPAPGRWDTLWKYLNSSVAIWFLSTIVVGLVTWSYAEIQQDIQAEARRRETVEKLDTEIASRIYDALAALNNAERGRAADRVYFTRSGVFEEAVNRLDMTGGNAGAFGTYPEYRPRGFRSLVGELQRLSPKDRLPTLKAALSAYAELKLVAGYGAAGSRSGQNVRITDTETQEMKTSLRDANGIIRAKLSSVPGWADQ